MVNVGKYPVHGLHVGVFFSSAKHHELSDLRALTILLFLLPQGLATLMKSTEGMPNSYEANGFSTGQLREQSWRKR